MSDLPPLARRDGEPIEDWGDRLVAALGQQHRAGTRPPLERYLAGVPGLAESGELPLDLVAAEWQLRRSAGERFGLKEYQARFPHRARDLAALWLVDQQLSRAEEQ